MVIIITIPEHNNNNDNNSNSNNNNDNYNNNKTIPKTSINGVLGEGQHYLLFDMWHKQLLTVKYTTGLFVVKAF